MRDSSVPKLAKWPFFIGDGLMVGAMVFIYWQSPSPVSLNYLILAASCLAAGAVLGILPFILEYRAASRVAEAKALDSVVSQIGNLQAIAGQISGATNHWQYVQEQAEKTVAGAQGIAERMNAEVKGFTEFMQNANDREKTTLKLEVEKLHRSQADWLQVLVRVLDHVYALNQGATHSGQQNVIQQVSHFQNACRDAARRIGLAPFVAQPEELFDPERHQLVNQQDQAPPQAKIADTVATGYTFQGKLLRPALVKLLENGTPPPSPA